MSTTERQYAIEQIAEFFRNENNLAEFQQGLPFMTDKEVFELLSIIQKVSSR